MTEVLPVTDEPRVAVSAAAIPVDPTEGAGIGSSSIRAWFVVYLLWLGALTAGVQAGCSSVFGDGPAGMRIWWVCLGTFYVSLANNFVPLPTMWMVMILASNTVGLPGPVPLRIAGVAAITAVATAMANLNEYHLLHWALGTRVASKVQRTRLVQWAIRWFRVSPFGILTLASFLPIPIDAVRWIAIADGYNRLRFFWANFVGRWARYALLAGATIWFDAGPKAILAVQGGIVAAAGLSVAARLVAGRVAKGRLAETTTTTATD